MLILISCLRINKLYLCIVTRNYNIFKTNINNNNTYSNDLFINKYKNIIFNAIVIHFVVGLYVLICE